MPKITVHPNDLIMQHCMNWMGARRPEFISSSLFAVIRHDLMQQAGLRERDLAKAAKDYEQRLPPPHKPLDAAINVARYVAAQRSRPESSQIHVFGVRDWTGEARDLEHAAEQAHEEVEAASAAADPAC
jgi:hypothetical protein